jgi:hypothetical protein
MSDKKVVFKDIIKEGRQYIFETFTGKRKKYWLKKGDKVMVIITVKGAKK